MEDCGDKHIVVAETLQVFFCLLLKCSDGSDVLNHVSALTVTYSDVLYALFGGKKRFKDGNGI